MQVTTYGDLTRSLPAPLRDVLPEGSFIHGIGVNVAQIGPFRRRPLRGTDAFYGLIFTDAERNTCAAQHDAAASFAACFAAKQAAVKALDPRHSVKAPQVEVLPDGARPGWMTARVVSKRGEPVPAPEVEMTVLVQQGEDVALAFVIAHGPAAPVMDALDTRRQHNRTALHRSLGHLAATGGEVVFSSGANDKVFASPSESAG
jgi:phosphopantetheinyl transferase (holo-ACP synthase)